MKEDKYKEKNDSLVRRRTAASQKRKLIDHFQWFPMS